MREIRFSNSHDASMYNKGYEQGKADAIDEILNRVEHEEKWLFACYRTNRCEYKENDVNLAFESIKHKIKQLKEQK